MFAVGRFEGRAYDLGPQPEWWGVFSADMGDEAKKVMHEQLDGIGTKLAAIETK